MLEHLPCHQPVWVEEARSASRGQAATAVGEAPLMKAWVVAAGHGLTKGAEVVVQGLQSWVKGVAVVHRWKEEESVPVVDLLVRGEAAGQKGDFVDSGEAEAAEHLRRLGLGHLEFWEEAEVEGQTLEAQHAHCYSLGVEVVVMMVVDCGPVAAVEVPQRAFAHREKGAEHRILASFLLHLPLVSWGA